MLLQHPYSLAAQARALMSHLHSLHQVLSEAQRQPLLHKSLEQRVGMAVKLVGLVPQHLQRVRYSVGHMERMRKVFLGQKVLSFGICSWAS